MDWKRLVDPDMIPPSGLLIGTIGRFTLLLLRDKTFSITAINNMFDHLSDADLADIKELVNLSNEWSIYHKFSH